MTQPGGDSGEVDEVVPAAAPGFLQEPASLLFVPDFHILSDMAGSVNSLAGIPGEPALLHRMLARAVQRGMSLECTPRSKTGLAVRPASFHQFSKSLLNVCWLKPREAEWTQRGGEVATHGKLVG